MQEVHLVSLTCNLEEVFQEVMNWLVNAYADKRIHDNWHLCAVFEDRHSFTLTAVITTGIKAKARETCTTRKPWTELI